MPFALAEGWKRAQVSEVFSVLARYCMEGRNTKEWLKIFQEHFIIRNRGRTAVIHTWKV